MTSNPRAGRGRGGMNFKAFRENYDKAFAHCKNVNCLLRYTCYRWLKTPVFDAQYREFKPIGDVCEFFVKDRKEE